MTLKVYDFAESLEAGKRAEARVVEYLRTSYPHLSVMPTALPDDKAGTDIITKDRLGKVIRLQVKGDEKICDSKNVFLETVSDEERGKPGWIWHIRNADFLIYVDVVNWIGYRAAAKDVDFHFRDAWQHIKKRTVVRNRRYNTLGIPVALSEFRTRVKCVEIDLKERESVIDEAVALRWLDTPSERDRVFMIAVEP